MNAADQQVMVDNDRQVQEMFRLEETGTLKKCAKVLGEFISKGASILLSALKTNSKKDTENLNQEQQPNASNIQTSKTASKRSKPLIISWKTYRDSTPQQNNPSSTLSPQNQTKLPSTQKNETKQADKKTPDSSFSDQYDSLKKRVKRDAPEKSSDTCTMAETRQETYEERRQFEKIQFQSFLMVQKQLRKVKNEFQQLTQTEKAIETQKDYNRYIRQGYGSNYNTSNYQQLIQLKNLKRTREARADRRPLRKKMHLQDEPQFLYDINKVYASFQKENKRREAERQEEERQRQLLLQEQKRRQAQADEIRRKIEQKQELRRKQQQEQQQQRMKEDQMLKEQQRLNQVHEQEQNPANQEKSQEHEASSSQKSEESNMVQTPTKIAFGEIKQISSPNPAQSFPPQANATEIKAPQNQNLPFQSPHKPIHLTPGSAKKQNPFIKSSPTPGINLQDVINNSNKSGFLFSATPPAPTSNMLNMPTPLANIFANNAHPVQPIFSIGKDQALHYNPNPIQQQFTPPFMGGFNNNPPTNALSIAANPNASFSSSSFQNSSSSSSYFQSPPNLLHGPGVNNPININPINPPAQTVSFSNNEIATKFFENPFMSSPPQPPGLFPSPNDSSWSQSQPGRRSRDGTKKPSKPIRIS